MKSKLIITIALLLALSSLNATNNRRHNRNNLTERSDTKSKDIKVEELPESVRKYIESHYSKPSILVTRLNDNGNYYVRISYDVNRPYPYYRSLVFSPKGEIIKE